MNTSFIHLEIMGKEPDPENSFDFELVEFSFDSSYQQQTTGHSAAFLTTILMMLPLVNLT